ncbi:lipoxygenase homology domain-containing protein 1-like [Ptychodera flava]|uniref:lipoxygenase homology domain-containing protein 1-like n=1 Tax=Ptychodera flava TaxID=63121 RepID=UPI00396A3726
MAAFGGIPPFLMSASCGAPLDDFEVKSDTAKIIVETGEVGSDCGTNAQVFIEIYGEDSSSGEVRLGEPDGGYFQPGTISEFGLKIETEFGKPYKIRVRHDNSGKNADWYLEKVTLVRDTCQVVFPCESWVSNKKGDKIIIKEFPAGDSGLEVLEYEVTVKTGKEKKSDTGADVWIVVYGERGDTGKRWLSKNVYKGSRLVLFKKGKSDAFKMKAVDLGPIQKVFIGHTGSKSGDDWYVEHVIVKLPNGDQYYHPLSQWLSQETKLKRVIQCAGMREGEDEDDDSD